MVFVFFWSACWELKSKRTRGGQCSLPSKVGYDMVFERARRRALVLGDASFSLSLFCLNYPNNHDDANTAIVRVLAAH